MMYRTGCGWVRPLSASMLVITLSLSANAQVVSQGHGELTLMIGQGSGPLGSIATDVGNQNRSEPEASRRHIGFRIVAGYQFADFVALDAGVTHLGSFTSRAAYLGSDQVLATANFDAIEVDLVAKIPFAPVARFDVTLGAAATALNISLTTAYGAPLPSAQRDPVNSKRIGASFGGDLELRLSEHTSLVIGYHAYPGIGSSRLVGSANGSISVLGGGLHVEF